MPIQISHGSRQNGIVPVHFDRKVEPLHRASGQNRQGRSLGQRFDRRALIAHSDEQQPRRDDDRHVDVYA